MLVGLPRAAASYPRRFRRPSDAIATSRRAYDSPRRASRRPSCDAHLLGPRCFDPRRFIREPLDIRADTPQRRDVARIDAVDDAPFLRINETEARHRSDEARAIAHLPGFQSAKIRLVIDRDQRVGVAR